MALNKNDHLIHMATMEIAKINSHIELWRASKRLADNPHTFFYDPYTVERCNEEIKNLENVKK